MFFLFFLPTILFAHFTLTGDELVYNDKQKKSFAKKNAAAEYANEDGKKYKLTADNITATHDPARPSDDNIKHLTANGNVVFAYESIDLIADHCTYSKEKENVECFKNVIINDHEKGNKTLGDRCIFDLAKNTYTLFGKPEKKAEAHLVKK